MRFYVAYIAIHRLIDVVNDEWFSERRGRVNSADLFDLRDKVALVTGGTRGIGRVVALRLAELGCRVFVCGRNAPEGLPESIGFRAADVRDPGQAVALVDGIAAESGRFDILVNNAGGSPACPAEKASPGFIDAILKLNLVGPLYLAQASHRHMRGKGGAIVNIASVSGVRPSPGTAVYGAAKAGLLGLTRSLAQEWGSDGIRVNAIVVGLARTETAEATYGDEAAQARVDASLPLGRMCEGDDVADAVTYLVSPLAAYVSGAQLAVDGGGEKPYFLDLVKGG
jgi:NAD(P)-dependent dehydrogenase (short-subunit alcohol dehydrogenase family)